MEEDGRAALLKATYLLKRCGSIDIKKTSGHSGGFFERIAIRLTSLSFGWKILAGFALVTFRAAHAIHSAAETQCAQ